MVLKRLLVTTLGALGLGALAAGPAFAQGEIPPPDLFDGQVACSSNVPDGEADAALGTALGMTIKAGDRIVLARDEDSAPIPGNPGGALMNLNYIIPPGNNNCGGGGPFDHDMDMGTPDATLAVVGPIATDVATGYTETLDAYLAVRVEDAAVKAASNALNVLLMDTVEDGIQTASITAARVTLTAAQAKQTVAHAALYAVGNGPINMAGIAEWRAKFDVEDAVTAWNTAVGKLAAAELILNPLMYAKYVPLRNVAQIDGLVDAMGNVNLVNLRKYANAAGDNSAVQDPETGGIDDGPGSTGTGNFDAAGNLLIPKSLQDHDDDNATDMVLLDTRNSMTYLQVNTRLKSVSDTVEALTKFKGDNKNALLNAAIDTAIQRAEAEQAYYQGQFDAMVTDTTNLSTVTDDPQTPVDEAAAAAFSIASGYGAFATDRTARDNAGALLELAFQAREAATSAVVAAFTNPQAFYQQLVDRREFTKAAAEAEVVRLAGIDADDDDAPSEADTKKANDAVTAAETALMKATEAQAAFQDLVAEGSPVKDLVETLLAPNSGADAGDDGGALVDAIAGAYGASEGATTAANNAVEAATAAGNAVAALTAEDDPETADVDETGAVTANSNAIAALTGDGGAVGVNSAAIAANEADIETLDGRVTVNEEDIDALDGRVGANETGIAANTIAITAEATAREAADTALGGRIDTNVEMIGTNVTNIATNATAIMAEQTARTEADMMLGGRIDTNADDIMMNAGNIMANEMSIGVNASGISTNADGIAANMNAIGANAASIADNRNMIGELSDDLSVVRAGVAASMALAGMPAINGRGISIGVGSFDGESAFAVGFQIQGEMASFKVGVTSGGGATGASAGVGFQF